MISLCERKQWDFFKGFHDFVSGLSRLSGVFASAKAKDPERREAHRLSKLETIQAWRGKIVDTVISHTIIPSIARRWPYSLAEAQRVAENLFVQQRALRLSRKWTGASNGVGFFEG